MSIPENSLRGILRGFGLKVGKTTAPLCAACARAGKRPFEPGDDRASRARSARVLLREFKGFESRVRAMARQEAKAGLLMSTPAVGPIVALTYASAIDDPGRLKSSKRVGAHFGLTPRKYQSSQTDVTGRISKIGDATVRTALYEAAHIVLTKPIKAARSSKARRCASPGAPE